MKTSYDPTLLTLTPAQLTDRGICPTCLNRLSGGGVYGDDSDRRLYADDDVEILFVATPRAKGHCCILSMPHYHDMSEAPDALNAKMMRYAKQLMRILCEVFGCMRVYLCSMCDGPNNHYHWQLIPRYPDEPRGSTNFVKPRGEYVCDPVALQRIREALTAFAAQDAD